MLVATEPKAAATEEAKTDLFEDDEFEELESNECKSFRLHAKSFGFFLKLFNLLSQSLCYSYPESTTWIFLKRHHRKNLLFWLVR
ncbi:hypothetical protein RHMOL_Rhmol01G0118300 [Rhododendron molle]|uniref:Uncharacterized protein n=1 Tax=Rhododendron molle TaxID=49168 RepID=A0ACC0Q2C1_RHOML|nr:hypothetical protein RHMOL_Rhmol01G0118300 [Rhododendron molle]